MKKSNSQKAFRRTLLALVLGIGLPLFVFTIATVLANRSAPVVKSAAPTSTEQAGPYTIALSIAPTPPQAIQFAHLTLRLTETSTQQTITDAGVQIRGVMERMEMSMGPLYANPQHDGNYTLDIRFSMNGFWQVQVTVTRPNMAPASVQIEITSTAPAQ